MAKTKEQIVSDLKIYIRDLGGEYSKWYIGIAADARKRLFDDHKVEERGGKGWIFRKCESSDIAREIEKYFIDTLGTAGGSGGGDDDTDKIYAYKITPTTIE